MRRLFFAVLALTLVCCTDYQSQLDEINDKIGEIDQAFGAGVIVQDGSLIFSGSDAPEFRLEDNVLQYSTDGGTTWTTAGEFGKECDLGALINYVSDAHSFGIKFGGQEAALSASAPSTAIPFTLTGDESGLEVQAIAPNGLIAKVQTPSASGGNIEITAVSAEADSTVLVIVSDGKGSAKVERLAVLIDRESFKEPDLPEFSLKVEYDDCQMRNYQWEELEYCVNGAVGGCSLEVIVKGQWTYEIFPETDSTGCVDIRCEGVLTKDPITLVASDNAGRRDTVEVRYTDLLWKVSVLGDSYSAYSGASILPYYPSGDVTSLKDMWWSLFISNNGFKQEKVNTWSGSTICCTGYGGADYSSQAFCTDRAKALGHPDIVVVCGGTNDSWAGSPVGDYKYSDWTAQDLFSFRPALAYMFETMYQTYGEDLDIYFILNNDLDEAIDESVKEICGHYDVVLVEIEDIDKQNSHPTKKGQRQIYEQLMECFEKE